MTEIWADIPGYEGYYQASNLGNIRGIERRARFVDKAHKERKRKVGGRILKQTKGKRSGRYSVMLAVEGKNKRESVHRLIALAFVPNPNPERFTEINHKDENPANNRPDNLEWCDRWHNMHYGTLQERLSVHREKQRRPVIAIFPDGTQKRYGAIIWAKADGYDRRGVSYSIKKDRPYKGARWFYEQP